MKLKPCPRCRGEAIIVNVGRGTYWVECKGQHCLETNAKWTEQEAIEAWNKRTEDAPK